MDRIECWDCGEIDLQRVQAKHRLVRLFFRAFRVDGWRCSHCGNYTFSRAALCHVGLPGYPSVRCDLGPEIGAGLIAKYEDDEYKSVKEGEYLSPSTSFEEKDDLKPTSEACVGSNPSKESPAR